MKILCFDVGTRNLAGCYLEFSKVPPKVDDTITGFSRPVNIQIAKYMSAGKYVWFKCLLLFALDMKTGVAHIYPEELMEPRFSSFTREKTLNCKASFRRLIALEDNDDSESISNKRYIRNFRNFLLRDEFKCLDTDNYYTIIENQMDQTKKEKKRHPIYYAIQNVITFEFSNRNRIYRPVFFVAGKYALDEAIEKHCKKYDTYEEREQYDLRKEYSQYIGIGICYLTGEIAGGDFIREVGKPDISDAINMANFFIQKHFLDKENLNNSLDKQNTTNSNNNNNNNNINSIISRKRKRVIEDVDEVDEIVEKEKKRPVKKKPKLKIINGVIDDQTESNDVENETVKKKKKYKKRKKYDDDYDDYGNEIYSELSNLEFIDMI